jgi:alcohol dehydrogenase class IV
MQDRPTSVELLEAAADFVDRELVPAIEGARQFQARVVANVMRVVAREIQLEDPLVRSEVKAIARLLGRESPHLHSLDDLRAAATAMGAELTARIRAGEADDGERRNEIFAVVRQSVEDKLRIANPRYLEKDIAIRNAGKGDLTNART